MLAPEAPACSANIGRPVGSVDLLSPAKYKAAQQQQHGDDLESPEYHEETENKLSEGGHGWSYQPHGEPHRALR